MFKFALSVIILFNNIQSGSGFVQPIGTNCKPTSRQHQHGFATRGKDGSQIAGYGNIHIQNVDISLHALPSTLRSAPVSSSSGLFGTSNSKERRRMPHITATSSSNHMIFDTSTVMRMAVIDVGDTDDHKKTILRKAHDATFGRIKNLFVFLLKLLLLKPFRKLKSILTRSKSIEDEDAAKTNEEKKALTKVAVNWEDDKKVDKVTSELDKPKIIDVPVSVATEPGIETKAEEATENIADAEENMENVVSEKTIVPDAAIVEEPFLAEDEGSESASIVAEEKEETLSTIVEEEVEIKEESEPTLAPEVQFEKPKGDRWAIAAPGVDLSGKWKLIASDAFKSQYDGYLKSLGQPSLVRSVAVSIVEMTSEEVIQQDEGRSLCIKGKNLRGIWDRTLVSSGSDYDSAHDHENGHTLVPLVTADKEHVKAEAWWENEGTTHKSWLRGVKKYGGGDFESTRFLEDNMNKLICESVFHPKDTKDTKEKVAGKATIRWEFKRVG